MLDPANPDVDVVVTGGAGFVGHHVVEHLLTETAWHITVLDGLTYAGDVARLADIGRFDPSRVDVQWHDLRAPIPSGVARRLGRPDAVLAIAAMSHVDRSIADPVATITGNTAIACHVFDWAAATGVGQVVHCSTDEVFGPAPDGVHHHEWDSVVPSNPYAASKAAQDAAAVAWWRTYGLPLVITHTMNMIGERQHPEKFLPLIVRSLLAGRPVTVHGQRVDGEWVAGSRKYLHARNLADAYLWLLTHRDPTPYPDADRPDSFNVVGDVEVANDQLVHFVAAILDVPARIDWVDFHSSRPGHDRRYSLDGSKLAAAGWTAPMSFRESLERTVLWAAKHTDWLDL